MKLKNKFVTSIGATALCLVLATSALAAPMHAQVSPFLDNLNVNLSHFPASVGVAYRNNNGVDISGPSAIAKGIKTFRVHISSNNQLENGFPQMIVTVPTTGANCTLQFIDGPYTYLAYKSGNPPSCNHIKVGGIVQNDQYSYSLNLGYKT